VRYEAQAENEDFINKINENIKKIIKEHVKVQVKEQVSKILSKIKKFVNEHLEAKVLTHSSNEAKTSHVVAANLSELELKKILIDKMASNKSIHRSDQHKTLYKALVDAYKTDKVILETYRDTVMFKSVEMMRMKMKNPPLDQTGGPREKELEKNLIIQCTKGKTSKSTCKSKEGSKSHQKSTGKSAQPEEPIHTVDDLEELVPHEFNTGFTEDQPVKEASQLLDWFHKPPKPPTLNSDWNKTFPAAHGPIQPWINNLA
nr:hypothetical protein [Tanacetum cinerariifolium]